MSTENEAQRRKYRFLDCFKANPETGCWEWQKAKLAGGYGQFWWGEGGLSKAKQVKAHRAAWLIFKGDPGDAHILHSCHNAACVNPHHLYLGGHNLNMLDRDEAGRTSSGEHRYNYKRSADLIQRIKDAFRGGLTAPQVCEKLGIGWSTLYRARGQDAELRQIMAETKSSRRSKPMSENALKGWQKRRSAEGAT